jgi:outer membrane putative beta-barrel porin/alpha-amylase
MNYMEFNKFAGYFACFVLYSMALFAAPITFNSALPVGTDEFVLREKLIFRKHAKDSSNAHRNLKQYEEISILGYGVWEDFAIFFTQPFQWKKLNFGTELMSRKSHGFGDLSLLGRYTIIKLNLPQKTFRVSPFIAAQFPTGESNAKDRYGRQPQGLQKGAGSYNSTFGIVSTFQTLDFQIDTQILIKNHHIPQTHFKHGATLRLDTSLQYRLYPGEIKGGLPDFIYGVLEINLIHNEKNKLNSIKDQDSGGTSFFVVPGVQYVTKRWILEAGVHIPVIQNLNGTSLKNNYSLEMGIRFNV